MNRRLPPKAQINKDIRYDLRNVNIRGQACLWNAGWCTRYHTRTAANQLSTACCLIDARRKITGFWLDELAAMEEGDCFIVPPCCVTAAQLLMHGTTWSGLLGSTVLQLIKASQLAHWHWHWHWLRWPAFAMRGRELLSKARPFRHLRLPRTPQRDGDKQTTFAEYEELQPKRCLGYWGRSSRRC